MQDDNDPRTIKVLAPARIHLGFASFGRASHGGWDTWTLKQSVDIVDEVFLSARTGRERSVQLTTDSGDDDPGVALALLAAQTFLTRLGIDAEVKIALWKEIPPGRGLGGRYSDAASTLFGLAHLLPDEASSKLRGDSPFSYIQDSFETNPNPVPQNVRNVYQLAYELGPEVPYFLAGGSMCEVSQGQQLVPMPPCDIPAIVLVFSDIEWSIEWACQELEIHRAAGLPDPLHELKENFKRRILDDEPSEPESLRTIDKWMFNDLETVVYPKYPELERNKNKLLECGAQHALLSGGSTVIGIFLESETADRAVESLKSQGLDARRTFLMNHGAGGRPTQQSRMPASLQ